MNVEIERLIKLAIADGVITEKERAVIMRKAEKLGEDIDEVEMILNGELALIKRQNVELTNQQKSNKEGELMKCPSCGAPVKSFTSFCPECGHEFRSTKSVSSITMLNEKLQMADKEERDRPRKASKVFGISDPVTDGFVIKNAIIERQRAIISSFPIPNTKEDIIEFLTLAIPEATKVLNLGWQYSILKAGHKDHGLVLLKDAWRAKCQQIIMKARFSMQDDKKSLEEIEYYSKKLNK